MTKRQPTSCFQALGSFVHEKGAHNMRALFIRFLGQEKGAAAAELSLIHI